MLKNNSQPFRPLLVGISSRITWWLAPLTATTILAMGVLFRLIDLDRIPGINGDEAWFGVQVTDCLAGRSFDWRTPTGNPLSPFHAGVLWLLHLLHPSPSFWLLRVPAALANLAMLGLAYPLLRKPLGSHAAILATLLLCSLPVNIVYSRIGWDPSQSACTVLISLGLILHRRYLWAGLAFLAALLVHPSNIFAAPILLGPPAADLTIWFAKQPKERRPRFLAWLAFTGVSLAILMLALPGLIMPERNFLPWSAIGRRAVDAQGMLDFMSALGRLLTGMTSYMYVVGQPSPIIVLCADLGFWLVGSALGLLGIRQLVRQKRWPEIGLAFGLLASLVAFYLVAGVTAISPHRERYALFCVAPAALLAAVLSGALDPTATRRWWTFGGTAVVCIAFLVSFKVCYWRTFERTGGTSHQTYWVGRREMKQEAFDIVARNSGNAPVALLAEDWWLYWPLRYLASGQSRIEVFSFKRNLAPPPAMLATPRQWFAIGFADGLLHRLPERARLTVRTWPVPNIAGKNALYVWQLPEYQTMQSK